MGAYAGKSLASKSLSDKLLTSKLISSKSGSIAGVSIDAASGKCVPASAAEWTTFLAAIGLGIGAPANLYLCQEANGNLADSIGTGVLTATNAPLYQQAVAGWSRGYAGFTDGTTQKFIGTVGQPVLSATSSLFIGYVYLASAPAATRLIAAMGTASFGAAARFLATQNVQAVSGANTVNAANNYGASVRPIVMKYDRTNSLAVVYTDQEKIAVTYAAGTTAGLYLGGQTTAPAGGFLWAAQFTGADAELTDAQVRSLLQGLAWSPAF